MLTWKDILHLAREGNPTTTQKISKSREEWRALLSEEEYRVTREGGTERAFSSNLCNLFEPGVYECVCCGTLLFDATEKFDSRTGWPSFTQPVQDDAISYHLDSSLAMTRIETTCSICDAHLGHVFPDGPGPFGLRYCMNAVALRKRA